LRIQNGIVGESKVPLVKGGFRGIFLDIMKANDEKEFDPENPSKSPLNRGDFHHKSIM